MSNTRPADGNPGTTIGALLRHFRLEEQIGAGANGIVYRAHDERLDRTVAVKVLHGGALVEAETESRLMREARAGARVEHRNVCRVYAADRDGGHCFLVTEHVGGQTLDELAGPGPAPDVELMVNWLAQAAEGLHAAHEAGLLHGDVKPSNIVLRSDGRVKLTDFGLARPLRPDTPSRATGDLTGTPLFASPEQCRGEKLDHRADIYGLGITAWTILVGQPPFAGQSLAELLDKQLHAELPSLRAHRPDVPPALAALIRTMCAKDPSARPQDMQVVMSGLMACCAMRDADPRSA